jgi:hypothetical protein
VQIIGVWVGGKNVRLWQPIVTTVPSFGGRCSLLQTLWFLIRGRLILFVALPLWIFANTAMSAPAVDLKTVGCAFGSTPSASYLISWVAATKVSASIKEILSSNEQGLLSCLPSPSSVLESKLLTATKMLNGCILQVWSCWPGSTLCLSCSSYNEPLWR